MTPEMREAIAKASSAPAGAAEDIMRDAGFWIEPTEDDDGNGVWRVHISAEFRLTDVLIVAGPTADAVRQAVNDRARDFLDSMDATLDWWNVIKVETGLPGDEPRFFANGEDAAR